MLDTLVYRPPRKGGKPGWYDAPDEYGIDWRAPYTPDDLLAMEDGTAYELVDGRLVELNLGFDSQTVVGRLVGGLHAFLKSNPVGVVAPEAGLQLFGGRKLRRPM